MVKKILVSLVITLLFLAQTSAIKAATPAPTPTTEPVAQQINSFELFWPLVSGKTMADPLYQLKILKEDIRGFFIFGKAQKADYLTFVATKRFLEMEKLINDNRNNLAIKTLDKGISQLSSAQSSWNEVKKGDVSTVQSVKDNIQKQLSNLNVFLTFLSSKSQGDLKSKLDEANSKVQDFQKSL